MDAGKTAGGELNAASSGYALSGKIMLTAIVVLFTTVLLILFLHLYLRWRTLHRSSALPSHRRRRRGQLSFAVADAAPLASAADRRGLDPAVLKCLPAVVFSPADGEEEGDEAPAEECAVCISEFEQGEEVRRLPRCDHRFHVECIDMWFRSHANCPLCRSAIVALASEVSITIPEDPQSSSTMLPPGLRSPVPAQEEGADTSSADLIEGELRIEVPARELAVEEAGLGSKSPGARSLLLRRLLSGDLMLCRGGDGGGSPGVDLERGDELSAPPPPSPRPPPTSRPPAISPAMEL